MFELIKSDKIIVRIYGVDYSIDRPTFGNITEMQSNVKERGDADALSISREFLNKLGVPIDVIDSLEVDHFNALIEHLTSPKKK